MWSDRHILLGHLQLFMAASHRVNPNLSMRQAVVINQKNIIREAHLDAVVLCQHDLDCLDVLGAFDTDGQRELLSNHDQPR